MTNMEIQFKAFDPLRDRQDLVHFLSSQSWPFHAHPTLSYEKALSFVQDGAFSSEDTQTYWILGAESLKVGIIKLFEMDDLEDGSPLFDLRILSQFQGQGIGEKAVRWLTEHLFHSHESLQRIEGTTRADNMPMRKIFRKCGYVKEGHYRLSWPAGDGKMVDTVRYTILRQDWATGTRTEVKWEDEE